MNDSRFSDKSRHKLPKRDAEEPPEIDSGRLLADVILALATGGIVLALPVMSAWFQASCERPQ